MNKYKNKIFVNLPRGVADEVPELVAVGRGADPRGSDIEAWQEGDAARLVRQSAKLKAAEATPKPEAAE
jgi:hypothetical protein